MDKVKESMSQLMDALKGVQSQYVQWVVKNPSKSSDLESSIKVLSYLLHGRLKRTSVLLPELIYCSANVLGFFHDYLIRQHVKENVLGDSSRGGSQVENGLGSSGIRNGETVLNGNGAGPSLSAEYLSQRREARDSEITKVKSALTIIDYLEVFLEVSARHLWGEFGRWVVIILIQAVKTGLRAALLFHYKVGLVGSSTVQQRYRLKTRSPAQQPSSASNGSNVVFVLKHSGRVVRKVQYAPSLSARDWSVPSCPDYPSLPQDLPRTRMLAEVIHLLRPLTHLVSLGICGSNSWKPWLLSLTMDMTSLHLHSQTARLRKEDKVELTRRAYAVCYYLLRSPFYDTYTKRRLLGTLNLFADKIPIIGNICGVLAHAIPEWQRTYSYMWTDY